MKLENIIEKLLEEIYKDNLEEINAMGAGAIAGAFGTNSGKRKEKEKSIFTKMSENIKESESDE